MIYLCLAVSVAWLVYFGYLFYLDRQVRDIRKRLDARTALAHGDMKATGSRSLLARFPRIFPPPST